MEIHICQTCGTVLRAETNNCTGCGSFVSKKAATALPVMSIGEGTVHIYAPADQAPPQRLVVPEQVIQKFPAAAEPQLQSFPTMPEPIENLPPQNGESPEETDLRKLTDHAKKFERARGSARASTRVPAEPEESENFRREKRLPSKVTFAALAALAILITGIFIGVEISGTINNQAKKPLSVILPAVSHGDRMSPSTTPSAGYNTAETPISSRPNIDGVYELTDTYRQPKNTSMMEIRQNGLTFASMGNDSGVQWVIDGKIEPPNNIEFTKQYIRNGRPLFAPIVYSGRYELDYLGRAYMSGKMQYKWIRGGALSQLRQTVHGTFKMEPLSALPPLKEGNQNHIAELIARFKELSREELSRLFLSIAVGLIGIGLLLAGAALKLFGTSGKLNVLSKQEYIPSQYKAQHNQVMHEWAKKLRPGGVPLGSRTEWRAWKPWQAKTLAIPPQDRNANPHILVIGGADKGKSRFVANMIAHDIESADRAVVVIDSDGQLSDLITRWIAAHQDGKRIAQRIVLIDPTSKAGSLSYNPLEEPEDGNLMDAANAIVHGFKAVYTEPPGSQSQWNQQTANILRNAAILLMANNRTLTDLPTLLQDNDFRDILLEGVEKKKQERTEYITLLETWGQYKRLARSDQWISWSEPILNRLTPMLTDPRIRPILTKPVGDLNLRDLILNKQVLIIRIPQGKLSQNANLLGSLLVTGLKQAALSLSESSSASDSRPVALYMDELNNFIEKETVETLAQETSRFQIGFVGCCKTLQPLPEDFRNNLLIQMGTICTFALSKKDADMLGPQIFRVGGMKIKHQTIQNFFNQVNTSPQIELISDEEKLNIDRVVGLEQRHFYCYKVGSVAGTFRLKTHEFGDIPDARLKAELLDQMKRSARSDKTR